MRGKKLIFLPNYDPPTSGQNHGVMWTSRWLKIVVKKLIIFHGRGVPLHGKVHDFEPFPYMMKSGNLLKALNESSEHGY